MPIRRLIEENSITADTAKAMHTAFNQVQAFIELKKIQTISSDAIARKVFDAVVAGEQDAGKIARQIIESLASKSSTA